jgi:hypothetical protein
LQSATPFPPRGALRVLGVVAAPLFVVLVAIVVERLSDLS